MSPRTPRTPADEAIAFFSDSGPTDGDSTKSSDSVVQIWELELEDDGCPSFEKRYIRLPPPTKPYILRISLSAGSVATRGGVLKTDFPLDGGKFERGSWKERKLGEDVTKPIKVDLPISAPGAFCYFIEFDESYVGDVSGGPKTSKRIQGRKGYFNVDPIITLPIRSPFFPTSAESTNTHTQPTTSILDNTSAGKVIDADGPGQHLPLDALSILSIIAKWQGPINDWEKHYAEAARRGYNFIHYTPLQSRGASGSPYSIYNQLTFDEALLKGGKDSDGDGGEKQIRETLDGAKKKYGLGSLTDVVLNHTANNSPFLLDHPEAGYSVGNTPHLAPALELDDAMVALSGDLASKGLPTTINSEGDLMAVMGAVEHTIDELNIWQYYVFDVEAEREAMKNVTPEAWNGPDVGGKTKDELASFLLDPQHQNQLINDYRTFSGRFITKSNPPAVAGLLQAAGFQDLADTWGSICNIINVQLYAECNDDLKAAKDGIKGRLRYTRLDSHGPRMGEISTESPLIETYFTRLSKPSDGDKTDSRSMSLANNGWMWAADPLKNFAEYPSKAYLRREVIVWGDCVKLRYGKGPEDNPWLWQHMIKYAQQLADLCDGFRLDNCHSTPLHVGVKIIDAAREINPNLYVVAELFTGSEEMDLKFVSEIGINSLVREAYNGHDPKDFSRLLYRFGVNRAIGSMDGACLSSMEEVQSPTGKGPDRMARVTPLQGSTPHAIFYDVTHDNETPKDKRTSVDALSTGALVTFTSAAIGSNKGFDDLYPKLLNLVTDKRMYEVAEHEENKGIGKVKRVLNHLHAELAIGGYDESHVHQEGDYIVIHRVHPQTHQGYLLVAHTAFNKGVTGRGHLHPFRLSHQDVKFIFGASLEVQEDQWKESDSTHSGMPSKLIHLPPCEVRTGKDADGPYSEVVVPDVFEPGSIMLFATSMLGDFPVNFDDSIIQGVNEAFADLDRVELNVILHRSDGEERDATGGDGVYNLPNAGTLVYCGLEGWMGFLRSIVMHNDLGHPLCGNLRAGTWAMDYIVERLEKQIGDLPKLAVPAKWLKERFDRIKQVVAPFLRPKYFSMVVFESYKAARRSVIEQCSDFVSSGNAFTHDLALTSVQMYGLVKSASIDPSKPVPSLAAGLPHFAAGWARCWGRDVFISLRGLFLTTGNYSAARDHILAFGSTLKHGLIPNLLDSTRNPRYNCRDGPWWMIQNIQDYTKMAPNGLSILDEPVKRRFPANDEWVTWDDPRAYAYSSTVAELVQEILQRHAEGIEFREYNAGPNLDMDMKDEGFNQKIWVDWNTGIIFGGNRYNCGTWMDKMGSSEKAGNKGLPATPRDGAPIEITGLLKSTLTWLDGLSSKGQFPFKGVKVNDGKLITYRQWSDLLQESFERCYWVPEDVSQDEQFEINSSMVNRRGIYKDVYGTPKDREWSDYQFRSNFPLAMIVAPELFTPKRAMTALRLADSVLRGPLGMKTLDPADAQYRGDYDNSNDSTDQSVAKGWNYHQGPEWVFPMGWFLMAWLKFDRIAGQGKTNPKYTYHHLAEILLKHKQHIKTDAWRGLPELTNSDGKFCFDSCNTQAWSSSTLLDVLEETYKIQREAQAGERR